MITARQFQQYLLKERLSTKEFSRKTGYSQKKVDTFLKDGITDIFDVNNLNNYGMRDD